MKMVKYIVNRFDFFKENKRSHFLEEFEAKTEDGQLVKLQVTKKDVIYKGVSIDITNKGDFNDQKMKIIKMISLFPISHLENWVNNIINFEDYTPVSHLPDYAIKAKINQKKYAN